MPTPITEQISQALATRLATITTANGYEQDVADVIRPTTAAEWQQEHNTLVLIEGDRVRQDGVDEMGGNPATFGWLLEYSIFATVALDDDSTTPLFTPIATLIADVEKAIKASPDWFGSLAYDVLIGSAAAPTISQAHVTQELTITVAFKTPEDDPYTARQ